MTTTLIVPGLKSSGPAHWQTWLERRTPGSRRVRQYDWNDAQLPDWSARIRLEISRSTGQIVIVAHSFGVLASVQAAADHAHRIAGALLVAPADPELFGLSEFLPQSHLPFPAIVVASDTDSWMSSERAAHWAGLWGAELLNLGNAGHINAGSGFGPWPQALALLERLRQKAEQRSIAVRRGRQLHTQPRGGRHESKIRARGERGPKIAGLTKDLQRAAKLLREQGWEVRAPQSEVA
jgi:predicted alpha/beta hydrolase family esterase